MIMGSSAYQIQLLTASAPVVKGRLYDTFLGPLVRQWIARRARHGALVEAVAPVGVVGLPRLVRGLHHDVGVARVVPHDEGHVAAGPGVVADEMGQVDPRDGSGRYRPRRRH